MKNDSLLGPWIRRFLLEHLVAERNLARNTQRSYRDTLCLLLPRLAVQSRTTVDVLEVEDVSAEAVRNFLAGIEQERGCSVATRNQRLSAIHALAHFIGERSPEHLMWCGEVQNVPFKRTGKNPLTLSLIHICLRFPFSTPLPLVDRIRTELEQSRFLRVQFQIELCLLYTSRCV